jgi:hypothetical protein
MDEDIHRGLAQPPLPGLLKRLLKRLVRLVGLKRVIGLSGRAPRCLPDRQDGYGWDADDPSDFFRDTRRLGIIC